MKKVLFVCLISLAICLSQAEVQEGTQAKPVSDTTTGSNVVIPKNQTVQTPVPATNETTTQISTDKSQIAPAQTPQGVPQNPPSATNKTEEKPAKSGDIENNTSPDKKKIDQNVSQTETKSSDINKPNNETTPNKIPTSETTNKTVSSSTPVPEHTSTKKNDTQPEITTKPTSTDNHVLQARGFDGPSFFGGIILTLGLLAIGFMGFKYYKNQTERNYHTL